MSPKVANNKRKSPDSIPVVHNKPAIIQSFLNKCDEDGSLYKAASGKDFNANLIYELNELSFQQKLGLAKNPS